MPKEQMHRVVLPLRLLAESHRRRGLLGSWARLVRIARHLPDEQRQKRANRRFDRSLGIETSRWVRVPELVTQSPNRTHAVRYQPSDVEEFELLMRKLPIDHRDFTFVDYGSGKGRVLLLAARHPFRRVLGVEFSQPLDAIARRNIAAAAPDESRIETFVVDAVDFEPPEDPLVLYFFNPFATPVLEAVLERVSASLARHPRPAYLVVTAPPEFARAVEAGGFRPLEVERGGWRTRGVFVSD